jgi:hypothetical protein
VIGVSGLSSGEVILGGVVSQGWWLVVDAEMGPGRVVAGPFRDRPEAAWAVACDPNGLAGARPVHGIRRPSGVLERRPSAEDWAWLADVGEQLERLPEGWDTDLPDDAPVTTLLVELAAAFVEAGLPLHDSSSDGGYAGGVCLTPLPAISGILVAWRQHDRMSVDLVHGPDVDAGVQDVMNRALADVLRVRGFEVAEVDGLGGSVVRVE